MVLTFCINWARLWGGGWGGPQRWITALGIESGNPTENVQKTFRF